MTTPKQKGLKRIFSAFGNSMTGLSYLVRSEAAFRQELLICAPLIPLAFFIADDFSALFLLLFSLAFVLVTEILNTAIEVTIDRIGLDRHALSGLAKDLGSAAVFLSLVFAVGVWSIAVWLYCV